MAKAVKLSPAGKCTIYQKLAGKPSEIKVLAMEVSLAVGAKHVEGWAWATRYIGQVGNTATWQLITMTIRPKSQ